MWAVVDKSVVVVGKIGDFDTYNLRSIKWFSWGLGHMVNSILIHPDYNEFMWDVQGHDNLVCLQPVNGVDRFIVLTPVFG